MNKRLLIILLLVSAAFNLAVIGSFIYMKTFIPRPPSPEEHFRDRRPELMGQMHNRAFDSDSLRSMRRQFHDTKEELMKELAKDPIDEAKINTILERSLREQNALERELGNNLLKQRRSMTAEEAAEQFGARAERMRRRMERLEHRSGEFRRFRRFNRYRR